MTIEELKALDKTELMYVLDELGDEILALVEGSMRFVKARGEFYETGKMSDPGGAEAFDIALAAFNAALARL